MKNLIKYLACPSRCVFQSAFMATVLLLTGCSLTADNTEQVAVTNQKGDVQTASDNSSASSQQLETQSSAPQVSEMTETEAIVTNDIEKTPEQLVAELAEDKLHADKLAIQQEQIEALYKQALDAMRMQDYQQAESLFEQILRINPGQTGVLINSAIIAKKQQNLEKARELLEKVVTVHKNHPQAQHLLATVYQQQGMFDKAAQAYEQALKAEPEFKQAMLNYAVLLDLYRGDWSAAKQYYQAFLKLDPDNQQVKMWLAAVEQKAVAAQEGQG